MTRLHVVHCAADSAAATGYCRAITAASSPAAPPDFNERTVALRLEHLLHRTGPPFRNGATAGLTGDLPG